MVGKRLVNTGEAAPFDALQNFEVVTYTGTGTTQKITGYIRKGAAFNGSDSRINTNDNKSFVADEMSISLWGRLNATGSGEVLISNWNSSGTRDTSFQFTITSANKLELLVYASNDSTDYKQYVSNSALTGLTDWNHFAFTLTNGITAKLYVNGSEVSTTVTNGATYTSGTINTTGTFDTIIGAIGNAGTAIDGKIDQVRIFNKALSQSEVDTLEAETYASSTKSTTDIFNDGSGVALYELDEDALTPFKQGAVFDGSSSYITINSTSTTPFDASAKNFTISAWINVSTFQNDATIITKYGASSGVQSYQLGFQGSGNNTKLVFYEKDGASTVIHNSSTVLTAGQWYHIGLVRNSTQVIFYINGSAETISATNSINDGGSQSIIIGRQDGYSSTSFNGKIDQVRIYSSALSSGDVTNLYNESSVPTANLVAHYKLDGNAEDVLDTYDGTETSITYSTGVYGGTPTNVNFLGMAFQPDLVWVKQRTGTANNHQLYNSVTDATVSNTRLYPNLTNAQIADPNGVTALNSNGFTLGNSGNVNDGSSTFVAWCWKAGGTASTISSGDISANVSANTDIGFSIVKYTGNGNTTYDSVPHGLNSTPELIINKGIDSLTQGTNNWVVSLPLLGAGKYAFLNTTGEVLTSSNYFGTLPDSTYFYVGGAAQVGNENTKNFISYCFHSVSGASKVGTYVGGGATNVTVTLDFAPRFVMIKRTQNTGYDWLMYDNVRQSGTRPYDNSTTLYANTSLTEDSDTARKIQFTDTGFVANNNWSGTNASGITYLYIAIA